MTTKVMVAVNGTAHEAHIVYQRRNEHGQFVSDENVTKVRGHEGGMSYFEIWVGDNSQVIISEHLVRHVGDAPGVDRENDGA